jgi:transposase
MSDEKKRKIRRNNIGRPKRRNDHEIIVLWKRGLKHREIAQRLGLGISVVDRFLAPLNALERTMR